jgi:hypothetical protein
MKLAGHLNECACQAFSASKHPTPECLSIMFVLAADLCEDCACGETRTYAKHVLGMIALACTPAELRATMASALANKPAPPHLKAAIDAGAKLTTQVPRLKESFEGVLSAEQRLSYPPCPMATLQTQRAQQAVEAQFPLVDTRGAFHRPNAPSKSVDPQRSNVVVEQYRERGCIHALVHTHCIVSHNARRQLKRQA